MRSYLFWSTVNSSTWGPSLIIIESLRILVYLVLYKCLCFTYLLNGFFDFWIWCIFLLQNCCLVLSSRHLSSHLIAAYHKTTIYIRFVIQITFMIKIIFFWTDLSIPLAVFHKVSKVMLPSISVCRQIFHLQFSFLFRPETSLLMWKKLRNFTLYSVYNNILPIGN